MAEYNEPTWMATRNTAPVVPPPTAQGVYNEPEWMLTSSQDEVAPQEQFTGGFSDRLSRAWESRWRDASDADKWMSDHPTASSIYRHGRRIAAEVVPSVVGAQRGFQYGRSLGPGGAIAGTVLGGAAGALGGLHADVATGNQLGDDLSLYNQLLTAAGGAINAPKVGPRGIGSAIGQKFQEHGISPTLGAQSQSKLTQFIEGKLRELPWVGGNTQKAVAQMYDDFGKEINRLTDDTLIDAGSSAGTAVRNKAELLNRKYKQRADELYAVLNKAIDPTSHVGADELLEFFLKHERSGASRKYMDDLVSDGLALFRETTEGIPEGRLNWQNLDDIRRSANVRREAFGTDKDRGLAKKIAELAKKEQDRIMDELAKRGHGHEAKAWKNANRYARRYSDWKDEALAFVNQGEVEKIWNALTVNPNLTKITKIKSAVGGGGSEIWHEIQSRVIRDMGRPAQQLAEDAIETASIGNFDPRVFLRNYNKVAKDSGAAKAFFGDLAPDMAVMAQLAEGMANPTKFLNRSKTAPILLLTGLGGSAGAFASGSPQVGVSLLAPHIAAFVSDVVMTNPKFIRLMAAGSKLPAQDIGKRKAWARAFMNLAIAEGYKSEGEAVNDYLSGSFSTTGERIPDIPV